MWGMAKCTIKGSVLLPQTVNRHLPRSPRQAAAAAAATGYLYLVSSTYLIYPCSCLVVACGLILVPGVAPLSHTHTVPERRG
jgi:hypothetical protein